MIHSSKQLYSEIICGLSNESTRKRLLTEDDSLTLERALGIAMQNRWNMIWGHQEFVMWVKEKSVSQLFNHLLQLSVIVAEALTRHLAATSSTKNAAWSCGKSGHIVKVCCSKPVSASSTTYQSSKKPIRGNIANTLHIGTPNTPPMTTPSCHDSEVLYNLFTVTTHSNRWWSPSKLLASTWIWN